MDRCECGHPQHMHEQGKRKYKQCLGGWVERCKCVEYRPAESRPAESRPEREGR